MAESDQQDGPEVRELVDAFRRAGLAVSEGIRTLYEWSQAWVGRRHSLVQFAVVGTVWFAGNWTYNRVAPFIIDVTMGSIRLISSEIVVAPVLGVLQTHPVLISMQIALILIVVLIVQNQSHTRKLNTVESKLTTMTDSAAKRTDGGPHENPPNGPRGPGGAVIGAIVGSWFGPGGVLAGIYLGFWLGVKLDYRAAKRDPLTPDPNAELQAKQ